MMHLFRRSFLKPFPFILFGIFLVLAAVFGYFQSSVAITRRPASSKSVSIVEMTTPTTSRTVNVVPVPTSSSVTPSVSAGTKSPVVPRSTAVVPRIQSTPTAAIPIVQPAKSLIIYKQGLSNLFIDYTYSYINRKSCDQSLYLSPPCSYAIQYDTYGGLDFYLQNGSIAIGDYTHLEWNMYLNNQAITNFSALVLDLHGNVQQEVELSQANITSSPAQGWVHLSVPIAQLDPKSVLYHDIQIKNWLSTPLSTVVHIDNVQLVSP